MVWLPEAQPQTAEESSRAPSCPEIAMAANERRITRIVHFTRISGLVGILASLAVKARSDLPKDSHLKYVFEENATDRSRDLRWHGYVNLSVSEINVRMFRHSVRWHPNDEWAILEFDPDILTHPGVVFSTTNNAYDVSHRAAGLEGFNQMFALEIPWGNFGAVSNRRGRGSHQPTNPQAEVLYPFKLSLEHLDAIIVGDEDTYDSVEGALSPFPPNPRIACVPEAFQ